MSFDSITYVWQVTTGHWRSDHAVAYDVLVWLSLQITGGLAALTFVQTVALAASLGYVCHGLRTLGVRGRWAAAAPLAVVLVPSTGTFGIFVWKDSAYAIAAVLAFGACAHLAARQRPALHWWLLAAAMTRPVGLPQQHLPGRGDRGPGAAGRDAALLAPDRRRHPDPDRAGARASTSASTRRSASRSRAPAPTTPSTTPTSRSPTTAPRSPSAAPDLAVMSQVAPLERTGRHGGSNCAWVDPLMGRALRPPGRGEAQRQAARRLGPCTVQARPT